MSEAGEPQDVLEEDEDEEEQNQVKAAVDVYGSIQFSQDEYLVFDGEPSAILIVDRRGGSVGEVVLHFDTIDSSAHAGLDYVAVHGKLSWADGETGPKTIEVPIIEDEYCEGESEFHVVVGSAEGDAVLKTTTVNVAIVGADSTRWDPKVARSRLKGKGRDGDSILETDENGGKKHGKGRSSRKKKPHGHVARSGDDTPVSPSDDAVKDGDEDRKSDAEGQEGEGDGSGSDGGGSDEGDSDRDMDTSDASSTHADGDADGDTVPTEPCYGFAFATKTKLRMKMWRNRVNNKRSEIGLTPLQNPQKMEVPTTWEGFLRADEGVPGGKAFKVTEEALQSKVASIKKLRGLVGSIHRAKRGADLVDDKGGRVRTTISDFVVDYLKNTFGLKKLAQAKLQELLCSLRYYYRLKQDQMLCLFTRMCGLYHPLPSHTESSVITVLDTMATLSGNPTHFWGQMASGEMAVVSLAQAEGIICRLLDARGTASAERAIQEMRAGVARGDLGDEISFPFRRASNNGGGAAPVPVSTPRGTRLFPNTRPDVSPRSRPISRSSRPSSSMTMSSQDDGFGPSPPSRDPQTLRLDEPVSVDRFTAFIIHHILMLQKKEAPHVRAVLQMAARHFAPPGVKNPGLTEEVLHDTIMKMGVPINRPTVNAMWKKATDVERARYIRLGRQPSFSLDGPEGAAQVSIDACLYAFQDYCSGFYTPIPPEVMEEESRGESTGTSAGTLNLKANSRTNLNLRPEAMQRHNTIIFGKRDVS